MTVIPLPSGKTIGRLLGDKTIYPYAALDIHITLYYINVL